MQKYVCPYGVARDKKEQAVMEAKMTKDRRDLATIALMLGLEVMAFWNAHGSHVVDVLLFEHTADGTNNILRTRFDLIARVHGPYLLEWLEAQRKAAYKSLIE